LMFSPLSLHDALPIYFFFAVFGLGVGVWCRFDFGEALDSGVSRGVADGVVSSVSPDSLANFVLRPRGDSCGTDDSLASRTDFSLDRQRTRLNFRHQII